MTDLGLPDTLNHFYFLSISFLFLFYFFSNHEIKEWETGAEKGETRRMKGQAARGRQSKGAKKREAAATMAIGLP